MKVYGPWLECGGFLSVGVPVAVAVAQMVGGGAGPGRCDMDRGGDRKGNKQEACEGGVRC